MQHLTEDDLVLHYYGELDGPGEGRVTTHLAACEHCHRSYVRLQRVMAAIDTMPVAAVDESFERTIWARLEPSLPARRSWFSSFVLAPVNLAWAAVIVLLVIGAFLAGRMSQPAPQPHVASAAEIREGILLADLGEHLDRSQTMLVELVTAEVSGETVDLSTERKRAEDLVAANRLYRQAVSETGDAAVGELLDELERLLVELSASPDQLSTQDMERVQQRVAAKDLLFKVRVVSSAVRERQKQQQRTRAGAGQSS